MQPVGELDQQHADVVAEREQELAQILGGALVLGLRLDLAELGDPVDQPGDVLAEQLLDLLRRRERVLDRVVEDRGAIVWSSSFRSVRMPATSIGWLK